MLDAVLPKIQAEREPEIVRIQALQAIEFDDAEKMRKYPPLRWIASRFSPLIRDRVRQNWISRQRSLRQGVTQVQLKIN